VIVGARIYRHDQEDRGAAKWCRYGLWDSHGVDLRKVSVPDGPARLCTNAEDSNIPQPSNS
jgi:hypothetical protein